VSTYALPDQTIDLIEHVIRTQANVQNNQADLTISRISVDTYATLPNKLQQARPIQVWVQRLNAQTYSTSSAFLAQNLASNDTTIYLTNVLGLPAAGFVKINNEVISYGAINQTNPSASAGTLLNCGRGQQGTFAAAATAGDSVYQVQPPAITVWPTPDQGTAQNPYYTFVYWRLRRIHNAGNGTSNMDIPFRFLPCFIAGLSYYLALKIPGADARLPILKQQYDEAWELAATEDREKAPQRFVPRRMFIT